jgi:hypothetical protein
MELATKLAGYKMLRDEEKMSVEKRAHTVRTRVGTPDIYAGGDLTPYSNRLFMFSNVALQGLRESLKVMLEDPRRAGLMFLFYSVFPTLLQQLAERGAFGEWLKDAYAKIPRFDKVYRMAIPLPMETKSGKQFYHISPHSEMGMVIKSVLHRAVNTVLDEKDVYNELRAMGGDLNALLPIGLGSLHPALKGGLAVGQYITGNNPDDFFRGQKVIPRGVYENGVPAEHWAHLGKFVWNNIGGTAVWRISDDMLDFEDKGWFEKLAGLPVVSNPISRFIRVSDRGLDDE